MQCQHCGHKNRQGRRYCTSCGAELSDICPECGFANEPGDKFCGGCARPFSLPGNQDGTSYADTASDESAISAPGELRQVTILFADIVDYARISTEKDPEEIHHLLSRFFEFVDGIVQSYGGRVDKHIGVA